jgi:hypothetical protein
VYLYSERATKCRNANRIKKLVTKIFTLSGHVIESLFQIKVFVHIFTELIICDLILTIDDGYNQSTNHSK